MQSSSRSGFVRSSGWPVVARVSVASWVLLAAGCSSLGSSPSIGSGTEPLKLDPSFVNPNNPSDKVETRVARLYYYRDAHRVAQIINRKVQSHNRQGVDMARQLADKARADADAYETLRKRLLNKVARRDLELDIEDGDSGD